MPKDPAFSALDPVGLETSVRWLKVSAEAVGPQDEKNPTELMKMLKSDYFCHAYSKFRLQHSTNLDISSASQWLGLYPFIIWNAVYI